MTPSLVLKLILLLAIVPVVYALMMFWTRRLPELNPARRWMEKQGSMRLAMYSVLAVWAIGGVALAVAYA